MRKIVLDIETKNTFQDVGKADPVLLDISVVCIWDSETDSYTSYLENELPKLWPILESADVIITFNGEHFDMPILNKYYHGDLLKIKHIDLMASLRQSLGRRIGLNTVAQGTLGIGKSGNGLDAVTWWKAGEIDKIIKYCIDDVKVTKEVYEFALNNRFLKYVDGGIIAQTPINTDGWENKIDTSMTMSLPF